MNEELVCTSIDKLFRGRNRQLAFDLLAIFDEMAPWWPLTVRQGYYQAVARRKIANKQSEYVRVSRVLTELRREELLPWSAVHDTGRRTTRKRGEPEVSAWLREQLDLAFNPAAYGRCYIQDQSVYVEVSIEKDALAGIVENALWTFCTRLNVLRGQASVTLQNQMAERFDRATMKGQQPILLHFGDLDPSGIAIPKALRRVFQEKYSLDVDVRRVALTPEQVSSFKLPSSLEAAKQSDPNYKAWVQEYGDHLLPVELDALRPDQLQGLVRDTMMSVYDMREFDEQRRTEIQEKEQIKEIRRKVRAFAQHEFPEFFGPGVAS